MAIEQVIDLLVCPLCGDPLSVDRQRVRCLSGHAFDLARQGYLNLYARSAPRNADSGAMVAARERFLGGGYYAPVEAALLDAAGRSPADARVLDCGAGTGHYLARVLDTLVAGRGIALDISVPAARRATRASDRVGVVVADAWLPLPVGTGVIDLVLSIFAPRNPAEFSRVLARGGSLVSVHPTAGHLAEIRERTPLIAVEQHKSERLAAALGTAFARHSGQRVEFTSRWPAAAVRDVVAMGPNAFHLDLGQLAEVADGPMDVTVSVEVTSWARRE